MNKDIQALMEACKEAILPMVGDSQEKAELVLLNSMKSFVALNEQEDYTIDKEVRMVSCLHNNCRNYYFTIVEYKVKETVCPHCNGKNRVRCYKNGSINVHLVEDKKNARNKNNVLEGKLK